MSWREYLCVPTSISIFILEYISSSWEISKRNYKHINNYIHYMQSHPHWSRSLDETLVHIFILFYLNAVCDAVCCAVLCINAYARWYFFACFFFKYKLCFSYPKFKYRSERCIGKSYNSIRRTVLYNQNGTWNEMKWHRKRALEGIEEKLINWIIRRFLWLCVWKLFLKFPLLNWFSPVPALQYAIILIPQATFSHQVNDSTRVKMYIRIRVIDWLWLRFER